MTREQYLKGYAILADIAQTHNIRMTATPPYGPLSLSAMSSQLALECSKILKEQDIPFVIESSFNCFSIFITLDLTEPDLSDIEEALKIHQEQVEGLSRLVEEL
jgi:hypothetical protein